MRVKDIVRSIPLSSRIRLVYERITLTRFTTCYIALALLHCVLQIILHSYVFANNTSAKYFVGEIVKKAGVDENFSFVKNDVLLVCDALPLEGQELPCWPVGAVSGIAISNVTTSSFERATRAIHDLSVPGLVQKRHVVTPNFNEFGGLQDVFVTEIGPSKQSVTLSAQCVTALTWPNIVLQEAMSEDVTFLAFQLWLLGMAVMTVLNQSIPHLFVGLACLVLATGWTSFQIYRSHKLETMFHELITESACNGIDVLPSYWSERQAFFIPIMVFNAVELLLIAGLTVKLYKVYAFESFKRSGASEKMNRLYKTVLLFSMFLQLSVFFTIASLAVWIDELCTGPISHFATHRSEYLIVFSITCVMELPWIIIGWNAIRKENRTHTLLFFAAGVYLVTVWGAMFGSTLYRWTFMNAPFFATLTITSFFILVATLVLAVLCRLGFGRGLKEYLETQETFDNAVFETVKVHSPEPKRLSLTSGGDRSPSANKRLSTVVTNIMQKYFGAGSTAEPAGAAVNVVKLNSFAQAREMDKRQTMVAIHLPDAVKTRTSPSPPPTVSQRSSDFRTSVIAPSGARVSVHHSRRPSYATMAPSPPPNVPPPGIPIVHSQHHFTSSMDSADIDMIMSDRGSAGQAHTQRPKRAARPQIKPLQLTSSNLHPVGLPANPASMRRADVERVVASEWF